MIDFRVAVDTGGTFTDFVFLENGILNVHKLPSTPSNPALAIIEGITEKNIHDRPIDLIHGSTVATNALLSRDGVKVGLITTSGFEDIIEIGRQNRDVLYDLTYKRPKSIVNQENRFGIKERIDEKGEVLESLSKTELKKILFKLKRNKIKSLAICFLHSYVNNTHELEVSDFFTKKGFPVSVSSLILSEYREFERTSTTCVNAYVSPLMKNYLDRLQKEETLRRFRVMQSNGGLISSEVASSEAVRTILSGPAGGVVGAFHVAKKKKTSRFITIDMGGTSADVSIIDGKLNFTSETELSGLPVRVPVIDIHTVGAGGGSIAECDSGGALIVGPKSAGASPGPMCYGNGNNVTVTDANLFLGRIDPSNFLGGKIKIDCSKSEKGISFLAKKLALDPLETAQGIITIANEHMANAIRLMSIERGHDPRAFTLMAFGGAGPMHACALAETLGIKKVLIPRDPGTLSARGMFLADVIKDYSKTVLLNLVNMNHKYLDELFFSLLDQARKDLKKEGVDKFKIEKFLDMRYLGQSHELTIPFRGIKSNFYEDLYLLFTKFHKKRFLTANSNRDIEIVNIRVRATGFTKTIKLERKTVKTKKKIMKRQKIIFDGKSHISKIYDRIDLHPGKSFSGPALVFEFSATSIIPPFWNCKIDKECNLILTKEKNSRQKSQVS